MQGRYQYYIRITCSNIKLGNTNNCTILNKKIMNLFPASILKLLNKILDQDFLNMISLISLYQY